MSQLNIHSRENRNMSRALRREWGYCAPNTVGHVLYLVTENLDDDPRNLPTWAKVMQNQGLWGPWDSPMLTTDSQLEAKIMEAHNDLQMADTYCNIIIEIKRTLAEGEREGEWAPRTFSSTGGGGIAKFRGHVKYLL